MEGKIVLARNPNPVVKPVDLPPELLQDINDPKRPLHAREGAVRQLDRLLHGNDKGIAISAYEALKRLRSDDSRLVSEEAARILEEYNNKRQVKETASEAKQADGEKEEVRSIDIKKKVETQQQQDKEHVISKTKFRSAPIENLTKDAVKSMLKQRNFYCKSSWFYGTSKYANPDGSGFCNKYEVQNNGIVIYDHASGLMWQQSGSHEYMKYQKAREYVDQLNRDQFAGYSDWRLPTLEEGMSLMKPTKNKDGLYIDTLFDKEQQSIWTSDTYSASSAWVVFFYVGYCYSDILLFTTSTLCVLFAEDNHRLFDPLNYLIISSEKA